ncbi:hypothetical protein FHX82_003477 [Amycolatopsis bartoniae]|uniref:Uncharacterized protein n=1 Tax=Amycolatopsis bartoniae TaxID=941986 RepID=A0A8H9IYE8_9PSEU|nr:hypothetical protein [Amycolatopsis bartoniae]MBB2936413.1 hypothetical protein [Amycolatopsis bartoniae]GHF69110.1 hypothetical protein GCM10017566_48760 [Amycolatopsis bartoniae]
MRDFTLDGQPVQPLTTDENRWQRLVFDDGTAATYQRMNGDLVPVRARVSQGELTLAASGPPFAQLRIERPTPDRLLLSGQLRDHPVAITLDRVDPNSFPLRSRGFHWVEDYAYFH